MPNQVSRRQRELTLPNQSGNISVKTSVHNSSLFSPTSSQHRSPPHSVSDPIDSVNQVVISSNAARYGQQSQSGQLINNYQTKNSRHSMSSNVYENNFREIEPESIQGGPTDSSLYSNIYDTRGQTKDAFKSSYNNSYDNGKSNVRVAASLSLQPQTYSSNKISGQSYTNQGKQNVYDQPSCYGPDNLRGMKNGSTYQTDGIHSGTKRDFGYGEMQSQMYSISRL